MKKILLLILAVATCILLFGCKVSPDSNGDNQQGGSLSEAFPRGSSLQVVFNGEWKDQQLQTSFFSALVYDLELNPKFVDDTVYKSDKEIVIRVCQKSIAKKAKLWYSVYEACSSSWRSSSWVGGPLTNR